MYYSIERNKKIHGPYDLKTISIYVNEGKILLNDKVVSVNGEYGIVKDIFKKNRIKYKIKNNGNILKQIKSFGFNLLLPKKSLSFSTLKSDQKLLILSLIGLAPAFLIKLSGSGILTFYAIALYFSIIWALFFYTIFKTLQVSIPKSIIIFFSVQVLIFISIDLLRINEINPFYELLNENNSFIEQLIGYIFGVGVFEELIKIFPVFIIVRYSKEPLLPQTVVFYGLISGIGFGVFEGVIYQLTVNSKLDYGTGFFLNIARLTSLPFLHAIWTAISAYFISFSFLYPTNRYSLRLLAILIPAILHGVYDVFTWSLPGLFISYLGVALLIIYLKNSKDFQNRITK